MLQHCFQVSLSISSWGTSARGLWHHAGVLGAEAEWVPAGGTGRQHQRGGVQGCGGGGLHSSSSQLNLSRFCHKIYPRHPLIHLDTPKTPPKQHINALPVPQKALYLSRKVDECKPLGGGRCEPGGDEAAGGVRRAQPGRQLH